jgi:hypothetical protein
MRLITAHKILIGTTIAFFLFFAGFEAHAYGAGGSVANLAAGVAGLAVAVGFAVYLRAVIIWQRQRAIAQKP